LASRIHEKYPKSMGCSTSITSSDKKAEIKGQKASG
jgi:hypothetical protein